MVNWDSIVSVVILVFIGLAMWARMSNQTIVEVIRDIKEMMTDSKDDVEEMATGVVVYD